MTKMKKYFKYLYLFLYETDTTKKNRLNKSALQMQNESYIVDLIMMICV